MKTGVLVSSIVLVRVAVVLCFFVLFQAAAQADVSDEFTIESVRTPEQVLAKFFPSCDPRVDARCPDTPPRCGQEDFRPRSEGFEIGAYRSCAALGGASPSDISGDVALGCACSATCEQSGKQVAGRWTCDRCLAVCD